MEISTLAVYHCLAFVWYFFISYSITNIRTEERPSEVFFYGGQWKYLTVLNLVLQAVFYGVSFLADVLRLIKKLRCAKCAVSSRDLLFSVLAFPVSTVSNLYLDYFVTEQKKCSGLTANLLRRTSGQSKDPICKGKKRKKCCKFVSISFWTLYSYNRELVYPKSLDGVIPLWLNHAMHTAILPFAVLEILALPHRYPAKKKGLILLGFVSFLYISWVLWIYSVTGEWVYPLFALFSPAGLAAFFAISLAIIISFYNFGEFLNRIIWGDSIVILDYRQKGK
ncbi:androgen-dependent TFPI-regulating protein [Amazona aestiva]|uniref:Androgen-dependent TFPI-regulating protein n=1 Tax=Amazona aestiva TaxID=12930 RepID=A0A0Q3PNT1_AMAAE|nr:androgen-dependent TFPI-regulating protein [Amazona aestiva]